MNKKQLTFVALRFKSEEGVSMVVFLVFTHQNRQMTTEANIFQRNVSRILRNIKAANIRRKCMSLFTKISTLL